MNMYLLYLLDELKKLGRRGYDENAIITEPKQTIYLKNPDRFNHWV